MTQKEISYLEDAVRHEDSIISIINDTISNLNDENLVSFFEREVDVHKDMKKNLLELLEVKSNG
ncbi:MAG: hypothetical protein IKE75_01540 [Bacilli bacterium]|nr:hypothetical protein [Bacilli bacterium]